MKLDTPLPMKYFQILLLLDTILWGAIPVADGQSPPLPSGRIMKPPADYAQWEIHFSYPQGSQDSTSKKTLPHDPVPEMLARDVMVTLTKPLWHTEVTDTEGKKSETWFDGSTIFLILPNAPKPNPVAGDDTESLPQFLSYGKKDPDFPDFAWVNAETYTGMEAIRGMNCFVFRNSILGMTAWVDSETYYPVRWQKGNETRDFTIMGPPAMLVLPDAILVISRAIKVVHANNSQQPIRGQ